MPALVRQAASMGSPSDSVAVASRRFSDSFATPTCSRKRAMRYSTPVVDLASRPWAPETASKAARAASGYWIRRSPSSVSLQVQGLARRRMITRSPDRTGG